MKSVTLILVMVLLFTASFIFADDVKKAISEKEFLEVFTGTWVNKDHGGYFEPQKVVYLSEKKWEEYSFLNDDQAEHYGPYTIEEMWMDSNGDIWFKVRLECVAHKGLLLTLGKISNSGKALDKVWQTNRFPTEISPIEGTQTTFYRQE